MKIVHRGNNDTDEKGNMSKSEDDEEVCGMSIKTEAVEEEDYVRCHHCGEKRKTKYELKEHIYGTHLSLFMDVQTGVDEDEKKKKATKCVFCQKKFPCRASLELHLKIHTTNRPINCDKYVCSSSNRPTFSLQNYKEIDEKTFKCTYCEYRTSDRSSLRWHIHSHTGEKPYKCAYCEYRSSNKSHLKAHTFKHTGEKPFNCSYCEFSASDP
ncbi:hypothetical protein J437_LFUL019406 [Ladona fulva]|uniref:C2H2-type domain-containing protein n=1 Tax=Ladona fulva TaxID=123851 RepID=A0A8K0PCH8_LADFU|nr:hypothetical protein J437_LFUL019406 [Ladona fulva]